MYVPIIRTRTTNVELNESSRVLIAKKFLSLGNYIVDPGTMQIDVVMREHSISAYRRQYYLSVKVATPEKSYMTVAIASRFTSTVLRARRTLRKQLMEDLERRADSWKNIPSPITQ